MRRSLLSSIFCFIGLLIISSSYFFLYPVDFSRILILLFFGLLFSLGLLVPAIFYYYVEERAKQSSRMFLAHQPVGHTFSLLYGIITISLSLFFFEAFGIIVEILWIVSGIFSLLGLILYKDDRKFKKLDLIRKTS